MGQARSRPRASSLSPIEFARSSSPSPASSLEAEITKPATMQSSIQHLPPEILKEIFLYSQEVREYAMQDLRVGPMPLALVCSFWRNVALSIPELWTTLSVVLAGRQPGSHIREWLARTHELPLHLSLTNKLVVPDRLSRVPRDFLFPIAHRLQGLRLTVPVSQFLALIELAANGMPLLEVLQLTIVCNDYGNTWSGKPVTFSGSPLLHTFGLTQHDFMRNLAVDVSWAQLTTLCLRDWALRPHQAHAILFEAINLVDCELQIEGLPPNYDTTILGESVHLDLRRLVLSYGWNNISAFLRAFTLPALKELRIVSRDREPDLSVPQSLVLLQNRSSFSLERLSLTVDLNFSNYSEFSAFMDQNPTLTELVIEKCERLILTLLAKRVSPRLERLPVERIEHANIDDSLLFSATPDFIWWPNPRVPTLHWLRESGIFLAPSNVDALLGIRRSRNLTRGEQAAHEDSSDDGLCFDDTDIEDTDSSDISDAYETSDEM